MVFSSAVVGSGVVVFCGVVDESSGVLASGVDVGSGVVVDSSVVGGCVVCGGVGVGAGIDVVKAHVRPSNPTAPSGHGAQKALADSFLWKRGAHATQVPVAFASVCNRRRVCDVNTTGVGVSTATGARAGGGAGVCVCVGAGAAGPCGSACSIGTTAGVEL